MPRSRRERLLSLLCFPIALIIGILVGVVAWILCCIAEAMEWFRERHRNPQDPPAA